MTWLRALIYRYLHDPDEDPVDLHFQRAQLVTGDVPYPVPVDDRVAGFPWERYEEELGR